MAGGSVNKVILVGNLGADPELRHTSSGSAVVNVSVATSEQWKDKNTGERQERTEWHRVVFFQRLAEIVEQYLHKGSKVYVEGQLRTRSWEQDGVKRYSTEIVAREMQMLDSRGEGGYGGGGPGQDRQAGAAGGAGAGSQGGPPAEGAEAATSSASTDFDDLDDDIPF